MRGTMMRKRAWGWRSWLAVAAAVVMGTVAPALAQPQMGVETPALGVGDKAPALRVAEWLRGDPVGAFEPGHVYAIEFWATWCGPCIAGIPHLAAVQKDFKGEAEIISVTSEDPNNTLEKVTAFVEARADMKYRVAFDEGDETWRAYMEAAGQGGIPCAFIIDKQGRIAWIGHPAMDEFERTIAAIVEDRFDLGAAEREREEAEAARERVREAQSQLHDAWESGDTDRAFELADEIIESDPAAMRSWAWWKFQALMIGVEEPERAYAFVRTMMVGPYREDAEMLMRFGSGIGESLGIEGRDTDLALDLAERAVALTMGQDSRHLATLAGVRMAREEYDEAIAVMERAVAVAPDERMRAYLQNELEFYEMDRDMAADRED